MRIIERVTRHYEAQDVEEFARAYRWYPETVVTECECGKRVTFKRSELIIGSVSACECGKDSTARIREEVVIQLLDEEDQAIHPWRYWHSPKGTGIPF